MMRLIARLYRAREGVAALEFALMAPFLMAVMLGGIEVSRFMLIHQKAEKVAGTLADVVAQSSALTQAQLNLLFSASSEIMQPYDFSADGLAVVSSVAKSGTAAPTIRWQRGSGGSFIQTSRIGTQGNAATLPTGFTMADKDNVIIAEVFFRYKPLFAGAVFGDTLLYTVSYYKPRLGALTTPPS